MEFEWDENKERINIWKHGVNFSEAQEAFEDENAIDDYDESHSSDEEHRFACSDYQPKDFCLCHIPSAEIPFFV